jgi:hypothetical protein
MQTRKLREARRHFVMMRLDDAEHAEFERIRHLSGISASELARRCFWIAQSVVEAAMKPFADARKR